MSYFDAQGNLTINNVQGTPINRIRRFQDGINESFESKKLQSIDSSLTSKRNKFKIKSTPKPITFRKTTDTSDIVNNAVKSENDQDVYDTNCNLNYNYVTTSILSGVIIILLLDVYAKR